VKSQPKPPAPIALPDGRRQRSERTRVKLAEALLALVHEGNLSPSAEEIAERSGFSRRAVFHHFNEMETLYETAIELETKRVEATLPALKRTGSYAERLASLVSQRAARYSALGPAIAAANLRKGDSSVLATTIRKERARMRREVLAQFAAELDAHPADARAEIVAALVAVTEYPFWESLRIEQRLGAQVAERTLARTISAVLGVGRR
jgi:AcrR family transcriptional regulator